MCFQCHNWERKYVQVTKALWFYWHKSKSDLKYHQMYVSVYERGRFGTVCVMHFRADTVNHHKLRTTTVFVEQKPSLSLLDNK